MADKQNNSDAEPRSLDAGPMIELRGVEKSYGDNVVLRGVDLAVSLDSRCGN
jgi:ABC-type transporter Mla maintaining outer membrane lipid asymmetry ATPase subunit MlaF